MPAGRHHTRLPPGVEQPRPGIEMQPAVMGKTQALLPGVKCDTLQPVTLLIGSEQRRPLYRLLPAPFYMYPSGRRFQRGRITVRPGSQKTALYQPHTAIVATQWGQHRHTQAPFMGAVIEQQGMLW